MADCTHVKAGQAAAAFAAYVDIDQADVANDAVEVVQGEETDVLCINAFDEQVADGVSVAVKNKLAAANPFDGIPPVAGSPSGVDRAGGVAVRVIEVQRGVQLIAVAAALADRFCPGGWERVSVLGCVAIVVRTPVAVKIVADSVQLLQVGDLDETVAIGVVFPVDRLGAGDSHCGGKNKQRERKEQGCSPDRVGHFVISKQLS